MKRVTITDVAHQAGVSKSTVSHVINKTRFVSSDTTDKVLKAVESLEYRPSEIARSLVWQRTHTAGLLISDVGNPFYHDVIRGVEDVALANDYSIFLCNTSYDLVHGKKLIESLIDKSVDGILFMSSSMSIEMVQLAVDRHIQTVVLDWGDTHVEQLASTITINFNAGTDQAVRHLVNLGHRRIALVSGPIQLWTARVRRDAFLRAAKKCNLDPKELLIIEGNLRIDGGRQAFFELTASQPPPSAVIAANDLTALGLLWTARNEGFILPDHLSIIGLDDIELASQVIPALTTISLPRYEIGKLAMSMLLDLIQNPASLHKQREVATQLVVRESTTRAYIGN